MPRANGVVRTPELIERLASAAFEADRKGGHHKGGPWTWHMIPEDGRANYRKLIAAILDELDQHVTEQPVQERREFVVTYRGSKDDRGFTGNYVKVRACSPEDAVVERLTMLGGPGSCAPGAGFECDEAWFPVRWTGSRWEIAREEVDGAS